MSSNLKKLFKDYVPTENLFQLAQDDAVFLRRLRDGRYLPLPGKLSSTHRLYAVRPHPRYLSFKDTPKGTIRVTYSDPAQFTEFPNNEDGRADAARWLTDRREMAKFATPLSVVAVPRGRSYKHFVAQRAEAAANGSLYTKKSARNKANMATKKPAPPSKKKPSASAAAKDTKNGMTRPKEGSTTRKVWDLADKHDGERSAVLAAAAKAKINEATAMTQFGKWRAYHGLVGKRTAKPATKTKPPAPGKAKGKPTPPKRAPKAPKPPAPAAEADTTSGE